MSEIFSYDQTLPSDLFCKVAGFSIPILEVGLRDSDLFLEFQVS